jgi:hypothetical protein
MSFFSIIRLHRNYLIKLLLKEPYVSALCARPLSLSTCHYSLPKKWPIEVRNSTFHLTSNHGDLPALLGTTRQVERCKKRDCTGDSSDRRPVTSLFSWFTSFNSKESCRNKIFPTQGKNIHDFRCLRSPMTKYTMSVLAQGHCHSYLPGPVLLPHTLLSYPIA